MKNIKYLHKNFEMLYDISSIKNMDEIKLNFINLLNSDATIQLFRSDYNQEKIEDEDLYVYSLNLQENADEDNYKK